MAANIDITVISKRVPWVEALPVEGPDYTGGTYALQIRQKPGDTGTPMVSLTKQAAGLQGISCTYNASYIDPETAQVFPASVFLFQIDEVAMEALATGTPTDQPVVCHYDLQITPVSGPKFVLCYGKFTYMPGVTL